jgi:hypothetical protein
MYLPWMTIAIQAQPVAASAMARFGSPQIAASSHDTGLTGRRLKEQVPQGTARRSLYRPRDKARKLQARGASRLRNRLAQG